MKSRCHNPKNHGYKRYGAKGIVVCDEWLNSFDTFKKWALTTGYAENLTIERINSLKGYCSENCTWATPKQQANNTANNRIVTYNGVTDTFSNICAIFKKDYQAINNRLQKGWDVVRALETPIGQGRRNATYLAFNGVSKTVSEWTRELGLSKNTIYERLNNGWSVEDALTLNKHRKGDVTDVSSK
jgi:hypothetical protein